MLYFTKEAYMDRYKLSDGEGYAYVCNIEKLLKYIKKNRGVLSSPLFY